MFKKLYVWLDQRTGLQKFIDLMLIEHIPGGAKWRYVWGSTLVFVFAVQLITGILLMTAYSPGDSTAWSSVYFIQYEMDFGWLIRGLHHFGSQTMVVLIGLHMLQVVIAGAHLPPREINWWLGLGLLGAVLALSLTGYLLPWDQKGYWATKVATSIAGTLPGIGPWLAKVIVGGPEYGHHTLTRFYALHVGILPLAVIVLVIAHLAVFRRHGVTHSKNVNASSPLPEGEKAEHAGDGWFWPDQAFRDMLVSLVIFALMLGLVLYGHGHAVEQEPGERSLYERMAHAGRAGYGANLDAPADPGTASYPARPEWYFLPLFQLLKYFEGPLEMVGTVIIPNGIGVVLLLVPLLGYGRMRKFGHVFGIVVIVGILFGAGLLTLLALRDDAQNEAFQKQLVEAEAQAKRAVTLAREGVPASGAVLLMRRDPFTEGKKLFLQNCSSCHEHQAIVMDSPKYTASDLTDFGTEKWIRGLLTNPADPRYLGRTGFKDMAAWVARERRENAAPDKLQKLEANFDLIAKWLATHPTGNPGDEDDKSSDPLKAAHARGWNAFNKLCQGCHKYEGDGGDDTPGPDFTGYGSPAWTRLMLMAPYDQARYGLRNRNTMPAFRDLESPGTELARLELERHKAHLLEEAGEDPEKRKAVDNACRAIHMTDIDRELILRFLLRDGRVVFGGEPISGAKQKQ